MEKQLTKKEKIAIEYLAISGARSWRECYAMSREKYCDPGEINPVTLSKWKNSKIVLDYFNAVRYRENEREKIAIENAIKEDRKKRVESQPAAGEKNTSISQVDFTDRNQFIKYLNSAVNGLDDDKQKTDYLKMLSDLLRFKETETGTNSDIQRFYMPLSCQKCPLYLDHSAK